MPNLRLEGKVAVVSGAGTYGGSGVGHGAAAAIVFAREGARVLLVDAVLEWADATRAIIEEEGGVAISTAADVTSPDDCKRAIDLAVETFGGLDVLHNNVGGGGRGSVVEATEEAWERSISLNLMSMVNMSRYAVRVNCIMPGLMWTPRLAEGGADAREIRRSSTPLPVEGESWDIGWAALFLASDQARFITGIVMPVDGGFLLTSAPN